MIRLLEREFSKSSAREVQIDGLGNVIARLGKKDPVIASDAHVDTVDVSESNL